MIQNKFTYIHNTVYRIRQDDCTYAVWPEKNLFVHLSIYVSKNEKMPDVNIAKA